jgi:hypothetical protein
MIFSFAILYSLYFRMASPGPPPAVGIFDLSFDDSFE